MTEHTGTFLGYRDADGNEMHCAHARCISPEMCKGGCKCPTARIDRDIEAASQDIAAGLKTPAKAPTNDLWEALDRMTRVFRPFTLRPIGGEGSSARLEQTEQIEAHAQAMSALARPAPGHAISPQDGDRLAVALEALQKIALYPPASTVQPVLIARDALVKLVGRWRP